MVIEDDSCGDAQPLVLATPGQSFYEDVAACGGRENGQPLDDGGGDEVGRVGWSRLVAAAHDSEDGRSAASGTRHSQVELGNEVAKK